MRYATERGMLNCLAEQMTRDLGVSVSKGEDSGCGEEGE